MRRRKKNDPADLIPPKKIKKIEGVPINVSPPVFELRELEPPTLLNSWKN
jgi:hypothetical protein